VSASVRAVKRTIGVSAARATSPPSSAASAIPPAPTSARIRRMRRSALSTSLSGRTICTAPSAPLPRVSTRRCVPRTVRSLNARPRPAAAILRSAAAGAICGVDPCPPGTLSAPCGEMNCTYPEAAPKRAGWTSRGKPPPARPRSSGPRPPSGAGGGEPAPGTGGSSVAANAARAVSACPRWESDRSTSERRSARTAMYTPTAAASTASATATLAPAAMRARRVTARAARSRRRARCGSAGALPPAPACGADTRHTRAARLRPRRSHSPTRGRR